MEKSEVSQVDGLAPLVVPDGYMRVGPLLRIPQLLREEGIDPEVFIARLGIDPERMGAPDRIISLADAGRMLLQGAVETRCPWFGLRLGRETGLSALSKVSARVLAAETLGDALRGLVANLHLQNRGATAVLMEADELVTLGYTVFIPGVPAAGQYEACAIAIAVNILRGLTGASWSPRVATFTHRAPDDLRPYRSFFRCNLRFNAGLASIRFPRPLLDLALHTQPPLPDNPALNVGDAGYSLASRIRRLIPTLLLTGQCTQEQLASRLGMHRRMLIRRLEEEGTSFRTLMDEIRFAKAQQLLANTSLAIGDVASLLGYAEPSAFSRAFRRWSGVSPMLWRS